MQIGISEYIDNILAKNKFNYIVILTVFVWFFTHAYKADVSLLIAFIFGVILILYMEDVIKGESGSLNSDLESKLNSLLADENKPPPDHFYTEPDFITFFYSVRDFRIYNRSSYLRAINTANTLLKIRKSLENDYKYYPDHEMDSWQNFELQEIVKKVPKKKSNIKNHKILFENAESMATKSLNYFHSFIVNLPANKFYRKKHEEALTRYNILVFRVLDDILHHSQEFSENPDLIGINYGRQKPYKNEDELTSSFEYFYN